MATPVGVGELQYHCTDYNFFILSYSTVPLDVDLFVNMMEMEE